MVKWTDVDELIEKIMEDKEEARNIVYNLMKSKDDLYDFADVSIDAMSSAGESLYEKAEIVLDAIENEAESYANTEIISAEMREIYVKSLRRKFESLKTEMWKCRVILNRDRYDVSNYA